MSWRTTIRSSLVYLVAIVAGFGLAYLIVAFVVFPSGVVPRDVKVPNVTGLMYDDASQRLAQSGFTVEKGEERFNGSSPKGTVLEQSPPPGTKEGVGNPVTLVVSGGQRVVTVPTVVGMTKVEAQVLLEKEGFDVGEVSETSNDGPRGSVVSTRPAAGAQVGVPATITLVVSSGAAAITMPDLVNQSVEGARQMLTQLGARNVNVVYDPGAVAAKGSVLGQSPVAGATMLPGGAVQLRVAGDGTP
jgi:serine/threonine-protein kinase